MNSTRSNVNKIKRLVDVTKRIIEDCALENGGIVAANSTKPYFPPNAKNYFYIWPRDAAYTCLAANILGMKDISKNFFRWCLIHAEGFKTKGLFYEKYYPNGLKALFNFQPDQTGTILYAVHNYCILHPSETKDPEIHELITLAANGICNTWNGKHFTEITNDLWEERLCFPELDENFTYTLASCIKGLRCANEIIPTLKWLQTSREMKNRLDKHFEGFFVRSYGKLTDKRIDASILGLVYPFEIYDADDPKIVTSINEIEKQLVFEGGVHRYEHDDYDGWMQNGKQMNKGAGAWPLLNFWMSIYYSLKKEEKNAKKYYYWVLSRLKDNHYIPEQIFSNTHQVSVSPLLWSHTMFFLATKFLDLF
jgi:glucoamylase